MHVDFVIPSVVALFFSILFLWDTSFSMVEKKNVSKYLMFFTMGVLLIFDSILIGFGVFAILPWGIFEALLGLNLLWIFIVLMRCGK